MLPTERSLLARPCCERPVDIHGGIMMYRVSGIIQLDGERKFSKQVDAASETLAKEKMYVFFGNVYGLKRRRIRIERIERI